jgi:hypothetical protein
MVNMEHDHACREISGELREMAGWLAGGGLSAEQFRLGLTRMEERKLKRFGFKLSSFVSKDGDVHFSLRFSDTNELCASMDVNPLTGQLAMQRACL